MPIHARPTRITLGVFLDAIRISTTASATKPRTNSGDAIPHPDLDTEQVEEVFRKGAYAAAYSGFEGTAHRTGLADWLRDRGVDEVDVVGIATDYCVRATAEDASREGFQTRVLVDLTAGVAQETTTAALDGMRLAGVELVSD